MTCDDLAFGALGFLGAGAIYLFAPGLAGAQAPGGVVVSGHLTKAEAHDFTRKQLPPQAPELLLKDERADFFHTSWIHVQQARRCDRQDTSTVTCRYKLRLRPDRAHRKAHWFPIRCNGSLKVVSLSNGGLGGDLGNYRCVTKLP